MRTFSFVIIRRGGGALPDGVSTVGGKLVFGRAVRLNDSGVYECVVENNVGVGKTEIALTVTGKVKAPPRTSYWSRKILHVLLVF